MHEGPGPVSQIGWLVVKNYCKTNEAEPHAPDRTEPMRVAPCPSLILLLLVAALPSGAQVKAPARAVPAPKFEVTEASIPKILEALRTGRVTCRQLVEAYLRRIAAYDQPSRLNAIVVVNPAALADADKLDREFQRTHRLAPLEGIPIIVKDNYDTK